MKTEPAVERIPDSGGPSQDVADRPEWFDRVFTGDGGPPRLPEEPDRRRWEPFGELQSAVYFLLGLCCGLLAAYLIYHLGGRW
jgi:hypothetical protein